MGLSLKKMYQRFGISPCGLNADNYASQAFCQPGFEYTISGLGKSAAAVVKFKWFDFFPVGIAAIPNRVCLSHINGHKKSLVIDKLFLAQSPSWLYSLYAPQHIMMSPSFWQ